SASDSVETVPVGIPGWSTRCAHSCAISKCHRDVLGTDRFKKMTDVLPQRENASIFADLTRWLTIITPERSKSLPTFLIGPSKLIFQYFRHSSAAFSISL